MNLTLVTDAGAADEPVSLAQAKAYLRLDPSFTDDDGDIQTMITAARLEAEIMSSRELSKKQYILSLDRFPTSWHRDNVSYPAFGDTRDPIFFEFHTSPHAIGLLDPLISVDAFTVKASDGSVATLTANTDYIVDAGKHPGIVCPAPRTTWPSPSPGYWPSSAVQLTFTAGYTPTKVPRKYVQGILLLVSQYYTSRVPYDAIKYVAEVPFAVQCLFGSDRLPRF